MSVTGDMNAEVSMLVTIKGLHHYDDSNDLDLHGRHQEKVKLTLDCMCAQDENAVIACVEGKVIGYVSRSQAVNVRQLLQRDGGTLYTLFMRYLDVNPCDLSAEILVRAA